MKKGLNKDRNVKEEKSRHKKYKKRQDKLREKEHLHTFKYCDKLYNRDHICKECKQ
jgi:hypothetical protein